MTRSGFAERRKRNEGQPADRRCAYVLTERHATDRDTPNSAAICA
jgi:hypothetical protein